MLELVAAAVHQGYCQRASTLSGQLQANSYQVPKDWVVIINDQRRPLTITPADKGYRISVQGKDYQICSQWRIGEPLYHATIAVTSGDQQQVCVQVERAGAGYRLFYRGLELNALVVRPRTAELQGLMPEKIPADMSKFLLSPMPGLLVRLAVKEGDQVKAGEELAVVEAMKMENSLKAAQDGTVTKLSAEQGESLMVDQVILEFE